MDQNAEQRRYAVTSGLEWLEQELERQKGKVEGSERALASYREEQNAMSLEDRQNIVVARLNQLNDAVTKAKTSLVQKESLYNQVKALGPGTPIDSIPAILQNQYIQSLKTQVAELERDRANLSERYGERHPEIIKVNASIKDATRAAGSGAGQGHRRDQERLPGHRRRKSRPCTGRSRSRRARRCRSAARASATPCSSARPRATGRCHENLLTREKELQVLASSRGNNVRLVEDAEVPGAPYVPNLRRSLMLASLVGLVPGRGPRRSGLSYLDDTVKTPEDITTKLRAPFLGMVPKVRAGPLAASRPEVAP